MADGLPAADQQPAGSLFTAQQLAHFGALYVARARDCGLTPSQSGARRFQAEVAAVQPNLERDGKSPAVTYGPNAINYPGLRLGAFSAQLIARSISQPTALHLHSNPSMMDAGAQQLLPLLEQGTCRSLDLGNCGLGARFAPAFARYMLRFPAAGSVLERLELGGRASTPPRAQLPQPCLTTG
jgi:hypothetical protein